MVFGIKLPTQPTLPKIVTNAKISLANVKLLSKAVTIISAIAAVTMVPGLAIQNTDLIKSTIGNAANTATTTVQKVTLPVVSAVKQTNTTLGVNASKVLSTVESKTTTLAIGAKNVVSNAASSAVSGISSIMYVGLGGAALVVLILLLK